MNQSGLSDSAVGHQRGRVTALESWAGYFVWVCAQWIIHGISRVPFTYWHPAWSHCQKEPNLPDTHLTSQTKKQVSLWRQWGADQLLNARVALHSSWLPTLFFLPSWILYFVRDKLKLWTTLSI